MALTSAIIRRAYRDANLIPLGQVPNSNQMTEGLESLATLILSTVGNEAGEHLKDLIIGGDFDQSDELTDYVPDNARLVLRSDGDIAVGLDPYPYDGQRFAIADTSGGLNTFTADANGRQIEGADTVSVVAGYGERQWMYQASSGNWVRISYLAETDVFPFPTEFEDYFVIMLAIRLNPRYGQMLPAETREMLMRTRSQMRARYSHSVEKESDLKPWSLTTYRRGFPVTFTSDESFDEGTIG